MVDTEIFRENIKRFYIVSVEKQNEIEKMRVCGTSRP